MKFLLLFLLIGCSFSQTNASWEKIGKDKFKLERVLRQRGVIWGFTFINTDELFFSKRDGELFHYKISTKKFTKLSAPKVWANGQGGLLDVLYHEKSGFLYLTYSKPQKEGATTALAGAKWNNDKKELAPFKDLLVTNAYSDKGIHFGSRLAIRADELFMTVGERGLRDKAQDIKTHHGTILRLRLDGSAYPNNPFKEKAMPEIYSYGHRNPQGIAFGKDEEVIFNCEFGPKGGDEVNQVKKGANYGWPIITYGSEYWGPKIGSKVKEGMEQPLVYYVPSISPSAMMVYKSEKNKKYDGNLFLAALGNQYIHRLVLDKEMKPTLQQMWLHDIEDRIRDIKQGPDESIYFSTDSGKIYKIIF